jgi:hypothetical protein
MRKRIIASPTRETASFEDDWLDLESLAEVEVTSEDGAHPIEAALVPGHGSGWSAAARGKQTIRLLFTRPQRVKRICLVYEEPVIPRTQEYVLRWSADGGQSYREITRQQWNFSPQGAISEAEDHRVDLPGVTTLELTIIPDISGGDAIASLARLRLA